MFLIQKQVGAFKYYAKFVYMARYVFSSWEGLKDNATQFKFREDAAYLIAQIPNTLLEETQIVEF